MADGCDVISHLHFMFVRRPLDAAMTTPHHRNRLVFLLCTTAAVVGVWLPFVPPLMAHGGHDHGGGGEASEADPDAPKEVPAETAQYLGLAVEQVEYRSIAQVIHIPGRIEALPAHRYAVAVRVAGQVIAITKNVGEPVKTGEVLARLESPDFARNRYDVRKLESDVLRLRLDQARAKAEGSRLGSDVVAARAKQTLATSEVERAQSLRGRGIAERDVLQREAEQAIAVAEVKRIETSILLSGEEVANLDEQAKALTLSRAALLAISNVPADLPMGSDLDATYEIRAQADGVVVDRQAELGMWVPVGQTLLTVADYRQVQVEGEAIEAQIPHLRNTAGKAARIHTDGGTVASGTVVWLAPEVDPVKRTAHLRIDVDNADGQLFGGQWVDAAVVVENKPQVIAVPKAAIVFDGPAPYVYIKDGETYQRHPVALGIQDDQYIEITAGALPGDSVVIHGADGLARLRPKAKAIEMKK